MRILRFCFIILAGCGALFAEDARPALRFSPQPFGSKFVERFATPDNGCNVYVRKDGLLDLVSRGRFSDGTMVIQTLTIGKNESGSFSVAEKRSVNGRPADENEIRNAGYDMFTLRCRDAAKRTNFPLGIKAQLSRFLKDREHAQEGR